jgi:sRNA-binding protein
MRTLTMLPIAAVLVVAVTTAGTAGAAGSADQGQSKPAVESQGKAPAGSQDKSPSQPAAESSAPAQSAPAEQPGSQSQAQASAMAQAQADAEAKIEARKTMERIKERGAKVSSTARSKAESRIDAAATKTNEDAAANGSAAVATRLAGEFGMSPDQLKAEHEALGCSWGALMIAHSLDANTSTDVTAAQLVELNKEGTGWGQIAAGLGLKLGHVVSAVQAEGRVAAGLAKPDGKVAVIRSEGRADVGAGAAASAAHGAGGASATAQTGVGVGVKIKP